MQDKRQATHDTLQRYIHHLSSTQALRFTHSQEHTGQAQDHRPAYVPSCTSTARHHAHTKTHIFTSTRCYPLVTPQANAVYSSGQRRSQRSGLCTIRLTCNSTPFLDASMEALKAFISGIRQHAHIARCQAVPWYSTLGRACRRIDWAGHALHSQACTCSCVDE